MPKTRNCAAYRTLDCNINVRILKISQKIYLTNVYINKTFTKIDFGQWSSSANSNAINQIESMSG